MANTIKKPEDAKLTVKEKVKKETIEWLYAIVYAVIFGTIIRLFVFETMMVPTPSMVPTIEVGDRLFIEKVTYEYHTPNRGDVVVFWTPYVDSSVQNMLGPFDRFMDLFAPKEFYGHVKYVKRLVGKPGDIVKLVPVTEAFWNKVKKGETSEFPTWIKRILKDWGNPDYIPYDLKKMISQVQINGKTPEEFKNCYYIRDAIFATKDYYNMLAFPDKYANAIIDMAMSNRFYESFRVDVLKKYSQMINYPEYYKANLSKLDLSKHIYVDTDRQVTLKIPEGYYFFMGDNSPESFDSRYFGFVPVKNIIGTPFLRIYPFNRFGKVY